MKDKVQTELEELQETQATVDTRLAALEEEKEKALEQVKQVSGEVGVARLSDLPLYMQLLTCKLYNVM